MRLKQGPCEKISPQNMALYRAVPPLEDPEDPIDFRKVLMAPPNSPPRIKEAIAALATKGAFVLHASTAQRLLAPPMEQSVKSLESRSVMCLPVCSYLLNYIYIVNINYKTYIMI